MEKVSKKNTVQNVQLKMVAVVEIANGLKHIMNVSQKVCTLQMFTGHYGMSVGFPCNIYGKGKTL